MSEAAEVLEIPATITARGQTTVPAAIRRLLGLGKSGQIVFRRLPDGTITVAKADPPVEEDPALSPFLSLIERDLKKRPGAIQPITRDLYRRAVDLVDGIAVDLDKPLPSDEA